MFSVRTTNTRTSEQDCRMETQGSYRHLQTVPNQNTDAAHVLKLTGNVHSVGTITILDLSYFVS
jgi:hypothetical protein